MDSDSIVTLTHLLTHSYMSNKRKFVSSIKTTVVQKLGITVPWINHYPVNYYCQNLSSYPRDSDLHNGCAAQFLNTSVNQECKGSDTLSVLPYVEQKPAKRALLLFIVVPPFKASHRASNF